MSITTMQNGAAGTLSGFLRDRRASLAPAPGASARRRTPGLRREEVATRAGMSVTWYTWLEQGRGGPPSAQVLERLAKALELDSAAREVLFLLAQNRPPPLQLTPTAAVPPAVQNVIDALPFSPAIVKTVAWDVVAWNAAAVAVLADYPSMPAPARNGLRRLFGDPAIRDTLPDWEQNARFSLGAFRVDLARGGSNPGALALAAELEASSADFRRLWAESQACDFAPGRKRFRHPEAGLITMDYAAFPISGADGLSMIVFTPVAADDRKIVERLILERAARMDPGRLPTDA